MSLADRSPDGIDADALRQALADQEREGIRVEFKREVAKDAAEWALDVTSFANTAGGVLLVGAEETEGRLTGFPGLSGDIDAEIQRLESILRDRVDPGMPGMGVIPVDVGGATVLVVAVPRSWRGPHLVRRGTKGWQLARRNSSGKYKLEDVLEVRAAFAESTDFGPRARRWHEDRVFEVEAGETPVRLAESPFVVLTVQSLGAGAPGAPPVLDVAAAQSDEPHNRIRPLYGSSASDPVVNVDGLLRTDRPNAEGRHHGLAQLYRDASLAYVDKEILRRGGFPAAAAVVQLLICLVRSVATVKWAGGSLPVVVHMSLHDVAGARFHSVLTRSSFEQYTFDRNHLLLPSVVIDRQPMNRSEAGSAVRHMLDGLWNAAGFPSCEHFDQEGRWVEPRR